MNVGDVTEDQHSWMKQSMPDYTDDNDDGVDRTNAAEALTDNEMYDAFLEQQGMVDIDLEDILEAEEGIPVNTDDSPPSVQYVTDVDRRTRLGLYMPPPLRVRTQEEIAQQIAAEGKRRAIREEEAMMVAAGYRYVRAVETRGEALLSRHPYLARYQVRQRSLLRNAWVMRDEEDNSNEEAWETFSVHMSWAAGNGSRKS
jgi:hypothetical protein